MRKSCLQLPLQSCAVESSGHHEPDHLLTVRARCMEMLDLLKRAARLAQNAKLASLAEGSTGEQIMEVFLEDFYDLVVPGLQRELERMDVLSRSLVTWR